MHLIPLIMRRLLERSVIVAHQPHVQQRQGKFRESWSTMTQFKWGYETLAKNFCYQLRRIDCGHCGYLFHMGTLASHRRSFLARMSQSQNWVTEFCGKTPNATFSVSFSCPVCGLPKPWRTADTCFKLILDDYALGWHSLSFRCCCRWVKMQPGAVIPCWKWSFDKAMHGLGWLLSGQHQECMNKSSIRRNVSFHRISGIEQPWIHNWKASCLS